MANDSFDDDQIEPIDDSGEARRKKRREFGGGLASRMNRRVQGLAPDGPGLAPEAAAPFLSSRNSHQVELLLAKRQHGQRNLFIRLGLFVLLPSLIVWFYAALIATPRYVCNFQMTYQAYQPSSNLASSLLQSDVGSSVIDSVDYGTLLYQYIRSVDLAEKVDGQINLRAHYSSHKIDGLSRLAKNASQAAFLAYWLSHVSVAEGFGGYITVQVQGFEPQFTLLLAQTITADADAMINGLGAQALASQVKSATAQLYIAGVLLKKSNDALTEFRNTRGDLDPSFAATQLATVIGTLEANLAGLRAELQQAQANMQPNAPQIVQLKLQVAALEQQIQTVRQRLSDATGSTYSNTVSGYNELLADQQFANTNYQSAQQGLIIAQANASARQNYAVAFVAPVLPDQPTLPDPMVSAFTVFLLFGSLYAICNLLFAAFRDQSGL